MPRLRAAAPALALLGTALLAACGGGSDRPAPAAAATTAASEPAAASSASDDGYGGVGGYDVAPGTATAAATAPSGNAEGARQTSIQGFAFEGTITIAAGTTVTWTNLDDAGHTVSARDGSFDSKGTFGRDRTFSATFDRAGRFEFYCQVHPFMTGTVVVK